MDDDEIQMPTGPMNIADKLNFAVGRALAHQEDQIDDEIQRWDNLDQDDLENIRRKRLESMKHGQKKKSDYIAKGHGKYTEIDGEKEFFDVCKKSDKVVCHFMRPSTDRCKIMDMHLQKLCTKHIATRFVKINAEKAQYLCGKLRIVMLPTVMVIKDGVSLHGFIGFDEFGDTDDFDTIVMERKFSQWQVLPDPDE